MNLGSIRSEQEMQMNQFSVLERDRKDKGRGSTPPSLQEEGEGLGEALRRTTT